MLDELRQIAIFAKTVDHGSFRAAGNLQYVLPDWNVDPMGVFAVWPSNAPKHGLVKHFINFLVDHAEEFNRYQSSS